MKKSRVGSNLPSCLYGLEIVQRPWLCDSSLVLEVCEQGIISTDILDQQLDEVVEHIRFIEVPDCRVVELVLRMLDREI